MKNDERLTDADMDRLANASWDGGSKAWRAEIETILTERVAARTADAAARLAAVEAELDNADAMDEDGDAWVEVAVIRAALSATAPDADCRCTRMHPDPACQTTAPDAGQREAQERAEVLREAAEALNVEGVGFQESWGSNPEDQAASAALAKAVAWLRARADRSPEQP